MALNPPAAIDRRGKQPLRNFDGTRDTGWPLGDKPESAPNAITDLSRGGIGPESTNLGWTLPVNTNGVRVYQRDVTASGAFVLIATIGPVNSYSVTGLSTGNQYEWKVVAFNDVGPSLDSNIVSGTTTAGESIPTISSVSGTVAQNETLSVNGSFTAYRNGQVAYLIGDNTAIGFEPAFLDTFGLTNVPQNYKHANDFSFNKKTGASLKVSREEADDGVSNAVINLPEPLDELYVSYEWRLIHGTDGTGGPQIKHTRFVNTDGVGTNPVLGPTMFYDFDGFYNFQILNGSNGSDGEIKNPNNVNSKLLLPDNDGEWRRIIQYYRRKDQDGLASRLFKIIDHATNQQAYHVGTSGVSGLQIDWVTGVQHDSASEFPNTWVPPRNFDYPDQYQFAKIYLPYYTRDQKEDWWVDCVHINDSLERVEVGNGPDIYTCGKLVQQFMSGRTTSITDIEFEQGNLLESENWYLFVTNRDGTPSDGFLIRSAT